jgi:hypothetical protein
MQPVVPRPGGNRELFGQVSDLAYGMLVRGCARDQVQISAIELGQLHGVLPVTIGVVGGTDLFSVTFQRHDARRGGFLRQLNGTLVGSQDVLGHRTGQAALGIGCQQGPDVSYLAELAGNFPFMLPEQPVVDGSLKQPGGTDIRVDNSADGSLAASQQRPARLIQAGREDYFTARQPPVTATGSALDSSGGHRHHARSGEPSARAY